MHKVPLVLWSPTDTAVIAFFSALLPPCQHFTAVLLHLLWQVFFFFPWTFLLIPPLSLSPFASSFNSSVSPLLCHFLSQIGLLVACYQGYVDVVIALSQCPYLDVNWQDSEGNTALITAAQAGNTHIHTSGHSGTSDTGLVTYTRWQAASQYCWTHAHTDTNIHTQAVWH